MTKTEFLRLRPRQNWMYKHALTTTGYYVAGMGIGEYQDKARYKQRYRSGRIVENPQGERLQPAVIKAWDMNGVALGHRFGNLDMETVGN